MNFSRQFTQTLSQNLSREELARLDELITPELAQLCQKAFGPELATLFQPFIVNDQPENVAPAENIQRASIQNFKGGVGNGMV
ncbi:hypothetical protein [Terasakiella pusilla]|uniref:hypothetical protein n=1 Tax=Terasakiella pusilla TaxID=64973 RepID=UPI003AA868A4